VVVVMVVVGWFDGRSKQKQKQKQKKWRKFSQRAEGLSLCVRWEYCIYLSLARENVGGKTARWSALVKI
jgi:hypothetical protein